MRMVAPLDFTTFQVSIIRSGIESAKVCAIE